MKKIFIILISCFILLLTACSQITEGIIYEKKFIPAHTELKMIPMVISNGKTVTTSFIYYSYHYDDQYIIYIQDINDESQQGYYYVQEDVYNICDIGMIFKYDEDRGDTTKEPVIKEKK